MKKLLVLILVLGIASVANAGLATIELRESDGVTPVADLDKVMLGSDYVLVVSGLAADVPQSSFGVGIYGSTYTAADWANLGPGNSTTTVLDTGDISGIIWSAAFQGYDMVAYDTGWPGGISDGDWFAIDLSGVALGTFALDLLDYDNASTIIGGVDGTVIPEPMTIALLGLGGLLLRRRK